MTKRFELTTDANIDEILLIIDHQDKVMWSFLKDHEEAVQGVYKRLNEQDQRIQELENMNTQLNADYKTTIEQLINIGLKVTNDD